MVWVHAQRSPSLSIRMMRATTSWHPRCLTSMQKSRMVDLKATTTPFTFRGSSLTVDAHELPHVNKENEVPDQQGMRIPKSLHLISHSLPHVFASHSRISHARSEGARSDPCRSNRR